MTDEPAAGTVSITGSGTPITPAKLSTVTCAPLASTIALPACDTPSATAKPIPDGATITLRAGDPLRFAGGNAGMGTPSGSDRICTIGLFVTDGTDTWALSGSSCAGRKPGGTNKVSGSVAVNDGATTVDGYTVGTTTAILMSPTGVSDGPGGLWTVPAVKLSKSVRAVSDISGVTTPTAGTAVTVRGASSDIGGLTAMPPKGATWEGEGTKPVLHPGDQGAPVVAGGKLYGLVSGQPSIALPVTPADKIVSALPQLGPNVRLLTK
ncbi:hypothetical protein [Tsukamurella pseudospumae]|uniref:hypothetical protein n=1 Tax=Tsukamurella pseudospumae TaxID=239498 RepID=UPI001112AE63|nr:hypothetical protein [Tsukamurella pseudospumae]